MTNAELITELTYCANIEKRKLLSDAADALEAADKRIAIVEEERDLERFAAKNYLDKIDELKAQLPKEGEWRGLIIDGQYWALTCSNCHQVGFNARTPYCPNCGARMKGEHDAIH